MEFQTYMQGVDKDWTAWSTRTEREFTQLGAGKWVFSVRARKAGGEISGEGVYEFIITPGLVRTPGGSSSSRCSLSSASSSCPATRTITRSCRKPSPRLR